MGFDVGVVDGLVGVEENGVVFYCGVFVFYCDVGFWLGGFWWIFWGIFVEVFVDFCGGCLEVCVFFVKCF